MKVRSSLLHSSAQRTDSGTVVGFTALNLLATLTEFFTLCRVVFG